MKVIIDSDLGLRHKADMTTDEFIEAYCKVFRGEVYATEDDSINEFEKLITHTLDVKHGYDNLTETMGITNVSLCDALTLHGEDFACDIDTSLVETAREALGAIQGQLFDKLKAGEMGGYASDDEISALAYTLTLMKLGDANG